MSNILRFKGYAKGAIRDEAEMRAIIDDVAKINRTIPTYLVTTQGEVVEIEVTNSSKIENGSVFFSRLHASSGEKFAISESLANLNIKPELGEPSGHTRQLLFRNYLDAANYGGLLMSDVEYQSAVMLDEFGIPNSLRW